MARLESWARPLMPPLLSTDHASSLLTRPPAAAAFEHQDHQGSRAREEAKLCFESSNKIALTTRWG